MDRNYFTSTLGEAARYSLTNPAFVNINAFLDHQAQQIPEQPAVGFFRLPAHDKDAQWSTVTLSFLQVRDASLRVAEKLRSVLGSMKTEAAALLCPTSLDFMLIWLACIRLDIKVLLLAPQCQPDAIVHLCKECKAQVLLYDRVYKNNAHESSYPQTDGSGNAKQSGSLSIVDIATILGDDVWEWLRDQEHSPGNHQQAFEDASKASLEHVAYIHHTSGTSSGIPKPISQSHNAAVGALPSLREGKDKATFTTTPLYHGGIADVFRSWTSGAMIWLYPGKDAPITAPNIVKALNTASQEAQPSDIPPISYFSCVPYVLQLLEEEPKGLQWLQKLDIVGVGGAALSDEVGDRLVKKDVNLVSRFGSAECGFIMSSHRDYGKDKAWQFLRDNVGTEFLNFEKKEDGLAELVIRPEWSHRAKTNREDGSFATSDLFEPHPTIQDAWRYHSRADSQLTLVTGKKFDPAPLEGSLMDSKFIADVLIFGNGKPYPGVLVFRSEEHRHVSDQEMLEQLWPMVEQLNSRSQDHARIARDMIKPMPWQEEPLAKSSKGTLLRSKAEGRFAAVIEQAYNENDEHAPDLAAEGELEAFVLDVVKHSTGRSEKLDLDTDLFDYGVDSVAAMRIRGKLRALVAKEKGLPATVVENCGTTREICRYITKLRTGQSFEDSKDETSLMRDLVDEYSQFHVCADSSNGIADTTSGNGEVLVLTGATGALGAHVLDLATQGDRYKKIVCLVRGEDEHAAKARLTKALERRQLAPYKRAGVEIVVVPSKLGHAKLGLDDKSYEKLAAEVTAIMHLAWEVNFRMNLRSFRSNSIASVTNLIDLALASSRTKPPRFIYCSSVASVINRQGSIAEEPSNDANDASGLGYSRSKWVAEQICMQANDKTRLHGHVSVLRVGQLAGDSKLGIWNEKEAWPMMLSTARLTESLPDIKDEPLNWLPVDIAAQAVVEAAAEHTTVVDGMEVLHVLNQHGESKWADLLKWLSKEVDFKTISPEAWISQLQELEAKGEEHPAFKLIEHWKDTLCKSSDDHCSNEAAKSAPHFETRRSIEVAPVLADIKPVDEDYVKKIWKWIDEGAQ